MSSTSRTKTAKRAKSKSEAPATAESPTTIAPSVYSGYDVWSASRPPKWHPVKKMRYVFWRMMSGITIMDAIREIGWRYDEFWHFVDFQHHGPYREEYARAKLIQARAFSESLVTIAEGRDAITTMSSLEIRRLIKKTLKKVGKVKSPAMMHAMVNRLSEQLSASRKDVIARNKLQMDAAKWAAKTLSPSEFGEKQSIAFAPNPNGEIAAHSFVIQFVGPDGKVVQP